MRCSTGSQVGHNNVFYWNSDDTGCTEKPRRIIYSCYKQKISQWFNNNIIINNNIT